MFPCAHEFSVFICQHIHDQVLNWQTADYGPVWKTCIYSRLQYSDKKNSSRQTRSVLASILHLTLLTLTDLDILTCTFLASISSSQLKPSACSLLRIGENVHVFQSGLWHLYTDGIFLQKALHTR